MAFELPSEIDPIRRQLETAGVQRMRSIGIVKDFNLFENGSGSQPVNAVERDLMRVGVRKVHVYGEG